MLNRGSSVFENEIRLKEFIVRLPHSKFGIDLFCARVFHRNIQPQSANARLRPSQRVDMLKQGAKNSPAAKCLDDINALNPPKGSVAPVAPFVSHEDLSNGLAGDLGKEIKTLARILQQGRDSGGHDFRVQLALLGFKRHPHIAVRDEWGVGDVGRADLLMHGAFYEDLAD